MAATCGWTFVGAALTPRIQALAQELVGLQPDIILANATPATVALQRETGTIPIVFVSVTDPVASNIVARLDRPSGNVTGFADLEGSMAGKWLELLSEIAPGLKRAAVMFNPDLSAASVYVPSFETAARSHAAHRRAHGGRRKRSRGEDSPLCIHSSAGGLKLDRWPQRTDGPSVGQR